MKNITQQLVQAIETIDLNSIEQYKQKLLQTIKQKKQIFTFGNGGSGSSASHMAVDLNKVLKVETKGKLVAKVICLNDNFASLLAYGNDINFNCIFEKQLENFMNPDDMVIAISGSGNSPNIIQAVDYARAHGGFVVGFSGFSGGKLMELSHLKIHIPFDDMYLVESIHMAIHHMVVASIVQDFQKSLL